MRPRRSALAWILAVSTTSLSVAGLTILLLSLEYPPQGGWGFRGFPIIFVIGSATLGWLIMVRRPDNRIGLLLSLIGLLNAGQLFLTEYASAGLRTSLPASNVAALVNAFIWVPTLGLMAGGIPLLFPDGRLPSPRWRPVAILMLVSAALLSAIIAADPGALDTPRIVRRDFRLPIDDATLNSAAYVVLAALAASVLASGASVFLRWRRATGAVREQLKWLALSAGLVVATMWLSIVPAAVPNAIFITAIGSVPVAVGVAVLRYRLYEIDAFINRTLVYGALTAILTGAFAALLKLLQTVFVAVTGNESDAATIITTLILATSFAPLKRALEKVVERRFAERPSAPSVTPSSTSAADSTQAGPAELESLLRRVVREELRAARADALEETPTA